MSIQCNKCGLQYNSVINSRKSKVLDKTTVKRRRLCACGNRFNTYEVDEDTALSLEDISKHWSLLKKLRAIHEDLHATTEELGDKLWQKKRGQ